MPGLLSPGEIASMQATIEQTLPDSCVINRLTRMPDGAGGWDDTWAATATLPCRVRPAGLISPTEHPAAERLQGRVPFTVTFPHETDVRDADTIQRAGDTTALEVIGASIPESWPLSTRVLTARIAPD